MRLSLCIEIITFRVDVQLTLCLVTEEAEVWIIHVAGWAGWINRGCQIADDAKREAYVGNVATRV